MKYAEVAVNSPVSKRRSFCYSIPPQLNIELGQAVWVPFGPRLLQGIVIEVSDTPSFEDTREIAGLVADRPLLSAAHVNLALWMSQYYLAPLFECIALMLPPGFERNLKTFIQLVNVIPDDYAISAEQRQLTDLLRSRGRLGLKGIEKAFGKKNTAKMVRELLSRGILRKTEELSEPRIKPRIDHLLRLVQTKEKIAANLESLQETKKTKKDELIEFLAQAEQPVAISEIRKRFKSASKIINSLIQRDIAAVIDVEVRRDPLSHYKFLPQQTPVLTSSQEKVWEEVKIALDSGDKKDAVFLLQGVTGSGKTEIYLRALSRVVSQGRKGICLVPEIALTPQTIQRFAARFAGRIAVFHSDLSPGEQFDEWRRISRGECDVAIGPRSALFVPQPSLGLIIIDEEHEWAYKQADRSPRYHARNAAIKLAQLCGATVILGSATPDVESYYLADKGKYRLISLQERITVRGITSLPEVQVIDLREELKSGNRSIFSRALKHSLDQVLERKEQAILFLNRRGTANFARCVNCGFIVKCPRCLVPLIYHADENKLLCHHCKYKCVVPAVCPECHKPRISLYGVGTQKVEQEISLLFPKARVIRWDSDVTIKHGAHEEILRKLVDHEIDFLIGTQMIAKGLDLPQVTLAGVINADTGLNLPDFRAAERTFQLTCQIAGRAGRGLSAGKVIIQTYSPEHYSIQAASKHDYQAFYTNEIEYRKSLGYPPFNQLASLIFSHSSIAICNNETRKMLREMEAEKASKGIPGLRFIGPVPAAIPRLRGSYRWQITICGHSLSSFLSQITFPRGWIVDIDPVGMV